MRQLLKNVKLVSISCKCIGLLLMTLLLSSVAIDASAKAKTNDSEKLEKAQQQKEVLLRGSVKDVDGLPLPGVAVQVKGTTQGTTTDEDGEYYIMVKGVEKPVLVFSFVGMKTQEVAFQKGKHRIDVVLEEDSEVIQEVVVTGIYTRKAESFTGSMATFKQEDLKAVGNQNVLQSLKLLDPSFIVLENNLSGSDPNATMNLNMRGATNIVGLTNEYNTNPNQPLFILDGFETTLATISDLSMDRVESITLLKDASSTAIYGSKAANGIIVVETKKPEAGKLRFNYNGNFTVSWADLTDYNLMNSSEKLEYERLAGYYGDLDSDGNIISESYKSLYNERLLRIKGGLDSYWMNEPLRTGFTQSHNIFAEGGDASFRYGIGLTYTGTDGVMKNSDRDVLNGNIQLTYRVDKFAFTNQTTISNTEVNNPTVNFSEFAQTNPFYNKYNEFGEVEQILDAISTVSGYKYFTNPIYDFNQKSFDRNSALNLTNNFQVEYRPIDELRVRAKFGLTVGQTKSETFDSPQMSKYLTTESLKKGSYSETNQKDNSYNGSLDITYGKTFDKHTLNAIAGMQFSSSNNNLSMYSAIGYMSDKFWNPNFSIGYPDGGRPSSTINKRRSASYYVNFNYAYDMRYLFDANVRSDGSSVYGVDNPFSTTWSVGFGWNVHNEAFLKDSELINYLKLRYSIGNPGNENINAKLANNIYTYGSTYPNMFGLAALVSQWGNSGLKWQRTQDQNWGIDLNMFNERLSLTFDYFLKKTDPLLLSIAFPPSSGTSSVPMNVGAMKNKGYTATVKYNIIKNKDFIWSANASLRHIKTTYYDLGDMSEKYNEEGRTNQSLTRYYDGASSTALWAVPSLGIDPMTGNEIFIKKNGSYTYEWDINDEIVCGDSTPDVEGTFGTYLYYKGFSFNAAFTYRYGGQTQLSTLYNKVENINSDQIKYNQDKRALYDRWQKPGDIAKFKRIDDTNSTPMSSRFIADDNTLQCSSISIGYETTTAAWLKTIGASSMSFRIYGNDLFRISTVKEERGINYPFARNISASIGVRF